MSIILLTYPLPSKQWLALLTFWQTEWPHTDIDWLDALRGAYAETLSIQLAVAYSNGKVVGTASVYYSRIDPEVCCVADVLTHAKMRGRGIAASLTELAVDSAFAAGCRVAYLGNKPTTHSVYEKVGFRRIRGAVMRRAAAGNAKAEVKWYRKGQSTTVRETVWGDLPGVASLLAQPLSCWFADYPRGLMSISHAEPTRCVSNFTLVWNDISQRGGRMLTLAGESPHRVLGFGTLTPELGAARSHWAVLDVVTHDHYASDFRLLVECLLDEARLRFFRGVSVYAMECDRTKLRHFRNAGFKSVTRLRNHFYLNGRASDVSLLELCLK